EGLHEHNQVGPKYRVPRRDTAALTGPQANRQPATPKFRNDRKGRPGEYSPSKATVVYSISGNSILRTENGVVTTIASSTDQLVPKSTDVELANTEYANTSVTFMPIFTSAGAAAERTGTSLYATAYLRNKRRGYASGEHQCESRADRLSMAMCFFAFCVLSSLFR